MCWLPRCLVAALLSLCWSTTIHDASFPQLRSPSPISSLTTISKPLVSSEPAARSQMRSSSALSSKQANPANKATKFLIVGGQASELVQMVSKSRLLAERQISGFVIHEALVCERRRDPHVMHYFLASLFVLF